MFVSHTAAVPHNSLQKALYQQETHVHGKVRFTTLAFAITIAICLIVCWWFEWVTWYWPAFAVGLAALGIHDLLQNKRAILRNYPLLGHLRFFFEFIRPEVRQYFFESDTEAVPFSRQQRAIVYQRAKGELDKRPFGTQ